MCVIEDVSVGIGFELECGPDHLISWYEPVFVFYDCKGKKMKVGLGRYTSGNVEEWTLNNIEPNKELQSPKILDLIVKFDAIFKMPEYVLKILNDFLTGDDKLILKSILMKKIDEGVLNVRERLKYFL